VALGRPNFSENCMSGNFSNKCRRTPPTELHSLAAVDLLRLKRMALHHQFLHQPAKHQPASSACPPSIGVVPLRHRENLHLRCLRSPPWPPAVAEHHTPSSPLLALTLQQDGVCIICSAPCRLCPQGSRLGVSNPKSTTMFSPSTAMTLRVLEVDNAACPGSSPPRPPRSCCNAWCSAALASL
jgi:hypothetical protein